MDLPINDQLKDYPLDFLLTQTQPSPDVREPNGLVRLHHFKQLLLLHLEQQVLLDGQVLLAFRFEVDFFVDAVELRDIMAFVGADESQKVLDVWFVFEGN